MQPHRMLSLLVCYLLILSCAGNGNPNVNGDTVSPDESQNLTDNVRKCAIPGMDGNIGNTVARFGSPGVDWYQNGFVANELLIENVVTGESRTVTINTDQSSRQISNPDPLDNRLPGLFYDTEGRVTAIDSLTGTSVPVAVSYNDNGTISRLRNDLGDSSVEMRFTYENGLLNQRTRVSNLNGQPESVVSVVCYQYDASGQLVQAVNQDPVTGIALQAPADQFRVDESGNIIEIIETPDNEGGFTARHVLAYDSAGNIVRHETYASDGALQRVAIMTFEASATPAPNLFGLLSYINPDFVPRYESTLP